jgi:protein-arginine kinase activator protein McsA
MRIEEDTDSDIEDLDYIINAVVGGHKKHRGSVPNKQGGDAIRASDIKKKDGEIDVTGKDLF